MNMPEPEYEMYIKKKKFNRICTDYMDEFGFEWMEEFTLNGA
jgi:hypothetical protein